MPTQPPQPAAPTDLERRVLELERRNRRLNLLAILFLGALSLGAFSAARADVVTAERFELVDADGNVRAEIGIDEDGSAGFFVRDRRGGLRACLTHDESASGMFLFDDTETIRVGAAQYAHGGGGLALHGDESKGAAVLYLKDRRGTLTFYDADGAVQLRQPE